MVEFVIDTEHPVTIPCGEIKLQGLLHIPRDVSGIVIFAHGSGSSRLSPRNQSIARFLQHGKFATLLFDLLTQEEDQIDIRTAQYRFNIELLAERLSAATSWLINNPVLHKLPMGYFGASTGGGAALLAASNDHIKAVVSRGGRPDLAGEKFLPKVQAATLLIVGENDPEVIRLNEWAFARIKAEKQLVIVPGASHLFEEPGALQKVAELSRQWFDQYLVQ